ncbi:MAG: Ldh family oxidoreductase [Dehalococcoidia bacterium]|nr:Ldh family oxidoreductase [Dehalococcoidia bacterium]
MLERFKVPVEDRVYVPAEQMREMTDAIFRGVGLSDDDAALAADVLIANDLRGIESHGVSNMLRSYVAGYRAGRLNPRPDVTTTRETATTAVLDGGGGLGLHVAPRAMDVAIEKAREFGLGAVNVSNVGHMGGAGYHALRALPHDMIGVAMSASGPVSVLPTFGAVPRLGTNPMAWAAPAEEMPPFLLDMGTSQVAQNKLRLARRVGAQVEPGWIAGPAGDPIMERIQVPDECYLLPLGGTREQGSHKGFGLGAIVDIMCSTLTGLGAGFLALTPGFHLLAYRIDAFVDPSKFKRDMDGFLRGLIETPPAPGHARVVYPGLLEAEEEQVRLAEGIPYHTEVIEWFRTTAQEMDLRFEFLEAEAGEGAPA